MESGASASGRGPVVGMVGRSGRGPVVGMVGRSGSGKTTLLESVVAALQTRDLRVGVVKHASHGFLADRPGKDSFRLYEAGAASVALASADQLATFTRQVADPGDECRLTAALDSLPPNLDLVLVEGFSWEPIPRFVIVPANEQPIPEHLDKGEVLRIVEAPAVREGTKPCYPEALITSIADFLSDLSATSRPMETDPSGTWPSAQTHRETG